MTASKKETLTRRRRRMRMCVFILGVSAATYWAIASSRDYWRAPLSRQARQLVGEWVWDDTFSTRCFAENGRFADATGHFEGRWSIENDTLTIEYWEPFYFRQPKSVRCVSGELTYAWSPFDWRRLSRPDEIFDELRRSYTTTTTTWKLNFASDSQTDTLGVQNFAMAPDGHWKWTRLTP